MAARSRHERAAPDIAAAGIPVLDANDAFDNAAANALALSKRSAGSFSSALATAAAMLGGTDFRIAVTGCADSAMIFMMICCADPPMCGGWPASISYRTEASE